MDSKTILTLILLISPILIIQLGMAIYSLYDLSRRKIIHGQRWAWAVGLILSGFAVPTGILVSALYLFWGRKPGMEADDDSD